MLTRASGRSPKGGQVTFLAISCEEQRQEKTDESRETRSVVLSRPLKQ